MNKKGFTLVELLGVIVILAIVMGLIVLSATGVLNVGKNGAYKSYEKAILLSAENYLNDYPNEEPIENTQKKIFLKDLISKGYLESFKDPNGGNCNDSDDNSYALVVRQAPDSKRMSNHKLLYRACLICLDGNTKTYVSNECVNPDDELADIIFAAEANVIYNKTSTKTSLTYSGVYKTINYVSNNNSVATVDENGVIHANSVGAATITVNLIDNVGITSRASLTINVIRLMAENIEYTPRAGVTCEGGVPCDNAQLILDKLAGIFKK